MAMQLERTYGENSVICEYSPAYKSVIEGKPSRIHMDILFCKENIPIKIKYRTIKTECNISFLDKMEYIISLADQGAHDEGSYGFWKDVCRLDEYKRNSDKQCYRGYAIFLTNDKWYVEPDYSRCKKPSYDEYDLNRTNLAIRSGRIAGKNKTLERVPEIVGKWIQWEVLSNNTSVHYWCYIAEV